MIKNLLVNIVFTILFILIVTPLGGLLKIFRKDYLEREINKEKHTYWK